MGKNAKLKDEKVEEEKKIKKEKQAKNKKEKPKEISISAEEGLRVLVRLGEKDVAGNKKIVNALLQVKGVGHSMAQIIANISGIDPSTKIGSLDETQISNLEKIIENPEKFNVPGFLLNRRKSIESENLKHVTASELIISKKNDIDFKKKIRCYQGARHEQGLPVRGQRT
ncbi:MAG: 30S ribosomal protein S13, partial [bacterium]